MIGKTIAILVAILILTIVILTKQVVIVKHFPMFNFTTPYLNTAANTPFLKNIHERIVSIQSEKDKYITRGNVNIQSKKPLGCEYKLCSDILYPGSSRCRVKCRDHDNKTGKSCKRPKSILSDSSLNRNSD
jgi:hypothetical protein